MTLVVGWDVHQCHTAVTSLRLVYTIRAELPNSDALRHAKNCAVVTGGTSPVSRPFQIIGVDINSLMTVIGVPRLFDQMAYGVCYARPEV